MKSPPTIPLVVAALLVASPVGAQVLPPEIPDSVRALITEFQTLRQQITVVQDSALLVNPQLEERRQDLEAFVTEQVLSSDPALRAGAERLQELEQEVQQAQMTGDTAAIQEIIGEGEQIRRQLQAAQAVIMDQDTVQARVEAFQEDVRAAMVEIDPEIGPALDRIEAIAARLEAIQGGTGGAGGG